MRWLAAAALPLLAAALGRSTEECEACTAGAHQGALLLQDSARPSVDSFDAAEAERSEFDPEQLPAGNPSGLSAAATYIEKLVERSAGHNITLTPSEKDAIETVRQFIQAMGTTADQQHAEDQAEVDRHTQVIKQCVDHLSGTMLPALATLKAQMESARIDHANCRIQEVAEDSAELAACKAYDDYRMVSPGLPACACTKLVQDVVRTTDPLHKQSMEGCLEETNSFAVQLYKYYKACKDAKNSTTNVSDRCKGKQEDFEQSYCFLAVETKNTCDQEDFCYATFVAARNATHARVANCEAARKADYKTGEYVKCLLDVIHTANSAKPEAFTACTNTNPVDDSKYDINYPDIPSRHHCEGSVSAPCDDDWVAQEYTSQPWYSAVDMAPCKSCPAPSPVISPSPPWKTTSPEKMRYLDYRAFQTFYPTASQHADKDDFLLYGWDQVARGTGISFRQDGHFVTMLDTVPRPFRSWRWYSTSEAAAGCNINIFGSNTAWTKEGDWTKVGTAEMVNTGIGPNPLQNVQRLDHSTLFQCWKLEWVSNTEGNGCPLAGWFKWTR